MKKLRVAFPTSVRRSMLTTTPRTMVQLGNLFILFHGNTPIYVENTNSGEKLSCLTALSEPNRTLPHKMGDGSTDLPFQEFLFHLARMLAEQAHSVIDPIIDGSFTGEGVFNGD